MASGYIEHKIAYDATGSQDLSTTAYKFHTLQAPSDTSITKYFGEMPSGGIRLSHIEIVLDNNGTSAGGNTIGIGASGPILSYDSNATQICQGPPQGTNAITLAPSSGSNGEEGCVLEFGTVITFPPTATLGTLYLGLKLAVAGSGDTAQCVLARLHWHTIAR